MNSWQRRSRPLAEETNGNKSTGNVKYRWNYDIPMPQTTFQQQIESLTSGIERRGEGSLPVEGSVEAMASDGAVVATSEAEDVVEDPVGDGMTAMLNSGSLAPFFRRTSPAPVATRQIIHEPQSTPQNSSRRRKQQPASPRERLHPHRKRRRRRRSGEVEEEEEEEDSRIMSPLLSRRNFRRVVSALRDLLRLCCSPPALWRTLVIQLRRGASIVHSALEIGVATWQRYLPKEDALHVQHKHTSKVPHTTQTMFATLSLMFVSVAMTAIPISLGILATIQASSTLVVLVATLLLDFNDVWDLCPQALRNGVLSVRRAFRQVEERYLLGSEYVGRWTWRPRGRWLSYQNLADRRLGFLSGKRLKDTLDSAHASNVEMEWRRRALDWTLLQEYVGQLTQSPKDVSQGNLDHQMALHFCYIKLCDAGVVRNPPVKATAPTTTPTMASSNYQNHKSPRPRQLTSQVERHVVKEPTPRKEADSTAFSRTARSPRRRSSRHRPTVIASYVLERGATRERSSRNLGGFFQKTEASLLRRRRRSPSPSPVEAIEVVEPVDSYTEVITQPHTAVLSPSRTLRRRSRTLRQRSSTWEASRSVDSSMSWGEENIPAVSSKSRDGGDSAMWEHSSSALRRLHSDSCLDDYVGGNSGEDSSFEDSGMGQVSLDCPWSAAELDMEVAGEWEADPGNPSAPDDSLDWLEVGAKIGIRLLNSEPLQRAVARSAIVASTGGSKESNVLTAKNPLVGQDLTIERLDEADDAEGESSNNDASPRSSRHDSENRELKMPVHTIWTSPAAVAATSEAETTAETMSMISIKSRTSSSPSRPHFPTEIGMSPIPRCEAASITPSNSSEGHKSLDEGTSAVAADDDDGDGSSQGTIRGRNSFDRSSHRQVVVRTEVVEGPNGQDLLSFTPTAGVDGSNTLQRSRSSSDESNAKDYALQRTGSTYSFDAGQYGRGGGVATGATVNGGFPLKSAKLILPKIDDFLSKSGKRFGLRDMNLPRMEPSCDMSSRVSERSFPSDHDGNSIDESVEVTRSVQSTTQKSKAGRDSRVATPPAKSVTKVSPSPPLPAKRRPVLSPGVKIIVPMLPIHIGGVVKRRRKTHHNAGVFQMATVVSCKRIFVPSRSSRTNMSRTMDSVELSRLRSSRNNCLSIKVLLDKALLRDGKFAEMTIRIMDEWPDRCMPHHSKFSIGACVATSYGIGVLVGWRVEDDCHVVRSLWQRRGQGSSLAYLRRDDVHAAVEAAVGFNVDTTMGHGTVLAYVDSGRDFRFGKYFVLIKQAGKHQGHVLEVSRSNILFCRAAQFIPVIEQIREAALYQIQLDTYKSSLRQRKFEMNKAIWRMWSEGFELLVSSLAKAVEDDESFDEGVSDVLTWVIDFLEGLDSSSEDERHETLNTTESSGNEELHHQDSMQSDSRDDLSFSSTFSSRDEDGLPGMWIINELFGPSNDRHVKKSASSDDTKSVHSSSDSAECHHRSEKSEKTYRRVFAFMHTLLRTVAIARTSCSDRPNLQMALSMCHESLLFIRTVIKVQQKNMSPKSIDVWKRTLQDIAATFGPAKERLERVMNGLAERLERQGNRAKIKAIRFVDILLSDNRMLRSLELGEWDGCVVCVESALVKAGVIDAESCAQYHETAVFLYNALAPRSTNPTTPSSSGAAIANLAKTVKLLSCPKRSLLGLLLKTDVLELIERILVRVFQKEKEASRILNIYAFNFHTFRHLRVFNNMAITGKLWKPLLDAADEEFAWAVSRMPENTKEFVQPISKLFSLGVGKFHRLRSRSGDVFADWLDFLMEDEAVKIIQDMDMKLSLSLEALCQDVKEFMVVLPYYSSIDEDFLNLVDEVQLDKLLKEAAEALVDPDRFTVFVREKSALAITSFLDYLPRMSIPIERRELSDGWVITCRGDDGEPLRLSDVQVEQENLVCRVLGRDNVLAPIFRERRGHKSPPANAPKQDYSDDEGEKSVLEDVATLIRNARANGCWKEGVGGVRHVEEIRYPALRGLPLSGMIISAIELWESHNVTDDELVEMAIKDVAFQIDLHRQLEEVAAEKEQQAKRGWNAAKTTAPDKTLNFLDVLGQQRRWFVPQKDPTVLYLEITKLSCDLKDFSFRMEPAEPVSIFDPVFEGRGGVFIRNVSIRMGLECRKKRMVKLGREVTVPVLQLQDELLVSIERVNLEFKETGWDWLLNKVVTGFAESITEVVKQNVKEQISLHLEMALKHLNAYIEVNPDLMLKVLGITMDDLEEWTMVWGDGT